MLAMDHTMIGTWNFLQFHLPQHWIPSSTHSTLHITPLLPSITPCICPWHSHYTHHPSLLLISQTHNHSQLHTSLHTPSHKLNTLHQSHSIHSLLHDCLIIQFPSSLLDCMPLWTHTLYSTLHLSMNTPYLTPSHHSNTDDTQDCTPFYTQHVLTPAHHSNTAGTCYCMPDWSHTLLRTDQAIGTHRVNNTSKVYQQPRCSGLVRNERTQSAQD